MLYVQIKYKIIYIYYKPHFNINCIVILICTIIKQNVYNIYHLIFDKKLYISCYLIINFYLFII